MFDITFRKMQIKTIVRSQVNINFDNQCMCLIPDNSKRRRGKEVFATFTQCCGERAGKHHITFNSSNLSMVGGICP